MSGRKYGAWMGEDDYEKNSTKYNKLANFYLSKKYSNAIFEKLLHSNRVSIPSDAYLLRNRDDRDIIYIRALYYSSYIGEAHLLISNDARRKIISLYKERVETESFKERLLAKMSNKLGYSLDEKMFFTNFVEILKRERAFTAGSFPLQAFLNENWAGSDLDIFVMTSDGFNALKRFLKRYCYSDKKLTPDDLKDSHYIEFNEVHEYTLNNGFRIQIVYANRTSVESVISFFDFDFCKIAWCFARERLYIQNRLSIDTRSCEYDLSLKKRHKCAERLQKYNLRGFSVTNWEKMLELEKSNKEAKEDRHKLRKEKELEKEKEWEQEKEREREKEERNKNRVVLVDLYDSEDSDVDF